MAACEGVQTKAPVFLWNKYAMQAKICASLPAMVGVVGLGITTTIVYPLFPVGQLGWPVAYSVIGGLLAGAIAAYGRVMTEVGISMMVGGNIKWHTRTITTAIALETNKGQFALGIALGIVLLVIAFIVNISVSSLRKRARI